MRRLCKATGLDPKTIDFVDAERSVEQEDALKQSVLHQLACGTLNRITGLKFDEAERLWEERLGTAGSEVVECHLSHYPDFAFMLTADNVLLRLKALLEFDGDTVSVCSSDLSKGLSIDIYTEGGDTLFEADSWGNW